jgi:DNA replication and repair protein RecF
LEALSLLSTSKSSRTAQYNEVVFWNKPRALIECELIKPSGKKTIRLLIEKGGLGFNKTFSLDGKIIEPKNVIGELKTVYFSPETLEIITGSPKERRRFLDILISQTDASHLSDLIEYKKIIINRNQLLKEIACKKSNKDEIIFWDEKLVSIGSKIIRLREKVCRQLEKYLSFYYKKVAGTSTGIALHYLPSVVKHADQ